MQSQFLSFFETKNFKKTRLEIDVSNQIFKKGMAECAKPISEWQTGKKCTECGQSIRKKAKDYSPEIKARRQENMRKWRAGKKAEESEVRADVLPVVQTVEIPKPKPKRKITVKK